MARRFLLDTNIVSHVARFPRGLAARRIAEVGERQVCTSIVVAAELRSMSWRSTSRPTGATPS